MDPNTIAPALVAAPVIASAGILGYFGLTRRSDSHRLIEELAKERAQREALLGQAAILRPEHDQWQRAAGAGQIAIAAGGSYSANRLPDLTKAFLRAGAADHLGWTYLEEPDLDQQQMCLDNLLPQFRSRVVVGSFPHFSPGFANASTAIVAENSHLWLPDAQDGGREWLRRIERDNNPGLLLALLSPGGSSLLARPPMQAFRQRYPHLPIYALTILDEKTPLRQRFPAIRQYYSQNDLVRGYIVCDNRRFSRRADVGIAMLLSAMVGATWISERPLPLWNGMPLVFPEVKPGQVATISVWAEMLPVYHLPPWKDQLPEVFYTQSHLVEEKAMRGIKTVLEHPELQSVPVNVAGKGSTRLCYVIAPITPPAFQKVAQRIDQAVDDWRAQDPDLSIHYASMGTPLVPQTQEVPMIVVLLQLLDGGPEAVDQLAQGAPIDPKFLPGNKTGPDERPNVGGQIL